MAQQRNTKGRPGKGQPADGRQRAKVRREELRKKERQRRILLSSGAVALVVVIVAVLVIVKVTKGSPKPAGDRTAAASTAVSSAVSTVPASVFNSVGLPAKVNGNALAGLTAIKATAVKDGTKPQIVYVGAEYCPFCAAERWPLTVALSRFGTFTNLKTTYSSSTDTDPSTPTLSFLGSTYSSQYVSFSSTEIEDETGKPLETMSSTVSKLFGTFDSPPYVAAASKGSIPFLDYGGSYLGGGAQYDPALLAKMTPDQVAAEIAKPDSTIGQAIVGSANILTAGICKLTGGMPATVCTSGGATAGAAGLTTGGSSGSSN